MNRTVVPPPLSSGYPGLSLARLGHGGHSYANAAAGLFEWPRRISSSHIPRASASLARHPNPRRCRPADCPSSQQLAPHDVHFEVMDKSGCRVNCGTMTGQTVFQKTTGKAGRTCGRRKQHSRFLAWGGSNAPPSVIARTRGAAETAMPPVLLSLLISLMNLGRMFGAVSDGHRSTASGEAMEIRPEFILTVWEAFRLAAANNLTTDPGDLRTPAQCFVNSPVVVLRDAKSGGASHATRPTRYPDLRVWSLLTAAGDLPCWRGSTCPGSCSRCLDDCSGRKHGGNFHHRSVSSRLRSTLVRGGDHHATPNFVEADR